MNNNPIGIFDSGLGGLTILNEIHKRLPNEKLIYYADSANTPYGEKSKKDIIKLSQHNVELLLEKNCKLIVVACNTATTNAIKELRIKYNVPFIGIEPAIKPAALNSKTATIGVLATRGTLVSDLFTNHIKKLSHSVKIVEVIGAGIVEAIENNKTTSQEFIKNLKTQLIPFLESNIDHLVLGCSHYPFIIPQLKLILGKQIQIIDSGYAVAKQTEKVLIKNNINSTSLIVNSVSKINIFTNKTSLIALRRILNILKLEKSVIINN